MRHDETRLVLILAAALTFTATGARAEDWCGYATKENAVIECGYTTASECESAVGKGGMCFVDPELALNSKRTPPSWPDLSRPFTTLVSVRK